MPIIVYKEFTATRSGRAIREEVCERCAQRFTYDVQQTVTGRGSSPFFLTNQRAQRQAIERADAHLQSALQTAIVLAACPHCGWYQKRMVRALLHPKLRWMRLFAWISLLGGSVFILLLHAMFSDHGRRRHYREKPELLIAEGILIGCWICLLFFRRLLVQWWDPNTRRRA